MDNLNDWQFFNKGLYITLLHCTFREAINYVQQYPQSFYSIPY